MTSLQLAFQTGHEGNPERPDPASLWGVTSVCPPKPWVLVAGTRQDGCGGCGNELAVNGRAVNKD